MHISARPAAFGVASLAVLLAFPATAAPAGPLPDPLNLPTLPAAPAAPAAPTVGVTPTGDGATIDVGAGETTLQIGAGTGGVTIKRGTRGLGSGTGGALDSFPVSIPRDRPGRSAIASGTGPTALLFGPSSSPRAAPALGLHSGMSLGRATGRRAVYPRDSTAAGNGSRTHISPLVAFIDRIPGFVRAGIAALAVVALGIWAAWVRARRRLRRNAFVDPVTGVANAPAFEGLLTRELERAKRYKRPLALVVLEVTQRHHPVLPLLDQTLRDVSAAIQDRLRQGDIVARLGPSRFAIICPEATTAAAETLARALELRLEELRLHVAVGTAERQPTDLGAGHLLVRAQAALARPALPPEPTGDRTFLQVA